MVSRSSLASYLDEWLDIRRWDRIDPSRNGLQVVGSAEGGLVLGTTDASAEFFRIARDRGAFFLVVHHGLFWGDVGRVDGVLKARLSALFDGDISLYAAHLPLDAHPQVGNNALLASRLGLKGQEAFGEFRGHMVGVAGELEAPLPIGQFRQELGKILGLEGVCALQHGPGTCQRVAVLSGSSPSAVIVEAAASGVDTLVVGELGHTFYHLSKEYGVNVLAGGHYATETWGVRAVLGKLEEQFPGLSTEFVDIPTRL